MCRVASFFLHHVLLHSVFFILVAFFPSGPSIAIHSAQSSARACQYM
jgi:hypothetical protein